MVAAITIPPPVLGWNSKDPIPAMDSMYAIDIENYFPNRSSVDFRNGYRYHSKSIGSGAVIALTAYETASVSKLVAVGSNNKLYDATTASAAATDIHGAVSTSNPFYYFQQFRDLLFVSTGANTLDAVYQWNGTGNIAGVTYTSTLSGGATRGLGPMGVYRSRLYFVQVRDTSGLVGTSLWFSGIDSTGGALSEFPFKSLLRLGGSAAFIGTVTRAKSFQEDSLFCIITTRGEVLVYEGDFPNASNWRLIGHYLIPRPLGLRAFFYIGPDLHVVTRQGVISFQSIIGGVREGGRYATISENIDEKITEAATDALLDDPYWTGINYPKGQYALINIPVTSGSVSHQYVQNTLSGAWTKFTGQNAFSWALFGDNLYFGGLSGRVFKADNGYFDEDPASEGSVQNRTTKLRPAYNYLGDREGYKRFIEARPVLYESEGLNLVMGADVDFADTAPSTNDAVTDSADTSYKLYRPQVTFMSVGQAISPRFEQTITTKRRSIQAITLFYEQQRGLSPGVTA